MLIKKYRNELKYVLSNSELFLIKEKISKILKLDKHTPKEGKYIIHSLYFDDYNDTALRDTELGLSKRYKWRIRYYDSDLSYIVLERKEKLESRCHKESVRLTIDDYKDIIQGNLSKILYHKNKLVRELSSDMIIYGYAPKVIIDYERVAYVEEMSNTRITFDSKISASYDIDKFLDGGYIKYYLQQGGENLLEVKFDYVLPSYIRRVIDNNKFERQSFSKYYLGRIFIKNSFLGGN